MEQVEQATRPGTQVRERDLSARRSKSKSTCMPHRTSSITTLLLPIQDPLPLHLDFEVADVGYMAYIYAHRATLWQFGRSPNYAKLCVFVIHDWRVLDKEPALRVRAVTMFLWVTTGCCQGSGINSRAAEGSNAMDTGLEG